ncbi:hypothetical protein BY458DRAFT_523554, partial [Sporodiniella umbellata]
MDPFRYYVENKKNMADQLNMPSFFFVKSLKQFYLDYISFRGRFVRKKDLQQQKNRAKFCFFSPCI